MHAGEAETSILLHRFPDVVHDDYATADHLADDRRYLLTTGVRAYAPDGVIGPRTMRALQTKIGAQKNGARYLDRATVRTLQSYLNAH